MSEKYKIFDQNKIYFVTFAVVYWVDVFLSRPEFVTQDNSIHLQEQFHFN
jgi:hypothetical protein